MLVEVVPSKDVRAEELQESARSRSSEIADPPLIWRALKHEFL